MNDKLIAEYQGDDVWNVPSGSSIDQFNFVQDTLVGLQSHKDNKDARRGFLKKLPEYIKIVEQNKDLPSAKYLMARLMEVSD